MFEFFGKAVVGIAGTAAIAFAVAFIGGFEIMLAVGAVHSWIHAVPTVGYWTAVLISVGLNAVFTHNHVPSSREK